MSEKPRLFGTDGVRGAAGEYPLDPVTVRGLGRAIGNVLGLEARSGAPRVLVGEDTRESSAGIARSLAAGLKSSGVAITYAGVITTPAVALLTREQGFDAGIVISASHNPYHDNGIKVLASTGMKLSETAELEIERRLAAMNAPDGETDASKLETRSELAGEYVDRLQALTLLPRGTKGLRIVIDCANGAASAIAPRLAGACEWKATVMNAEPDGRNINRDCGSLHPERMARAVKEAGADFGVAFDGDADRAIFATRAGHIADGDHVLYAAAPFLKARGGIRGRAVVGTLMTNLGLERALAGHGIGLTRTPVGDKYVLEEMLRSGSNLGGEPSGHIIFGDVSLSGDGMITLLQVVRMISETGRTLDELVAGFSKFPQIIRNVRVKEKTPLELLAPVRGAMDDCRREMGDRGRMVVRYSGTEPLARVMVEAEDSDLVERHAARIASAIQGVLGV